MNWNAVAAIGQCVEALVVLIGAPLVVWQLWQVREERTHQKWEALQLAMSLLDTGDIQRVWQPIRESEVIQVLSRWKLVSLAAQSGYLDSNLLFLAFGEQLGEAYQMIHKDQKLRGGFGACRRLLDRPDWEPAQWLLESAYKWVLKVHPNTFNNRQ